MPRMGGAAQPTRPATAPARQVTARPRRGKRAADAWVGPRAFVLLNSDWDRLARSDTGRTIDEVLRQHTLESTRDIKRWEKQLLEAQLAELEGQSVDQWLETTKRGLGLFLCLDSSDRLLVGGPCHHADTRLSTVYLMDLRAGERRRSGQRGRGCRNHHRH